MRTLHELATKLQEYIVKEQEDAHNQTNVILNRYNNLKLKVESRYHFPNVIVYIGISAAVFNLKENTKVEGGLGPDERYVRKWLGIESNTNDLKEIWLTLSDMISAEKQQTVEDLQEGEADSIDKENFNKRHKREFSEDTTLEEFFNYESSDTDKNEDDLPDNF